MRGKESIAVGIGDGIGITPAYAGKSSSSVAMSRAFTDHPRVCGEKNAKLLFRFRGLGSPPRMRGKGLCNPQGVSVTRITPACAGKSSTFVVSVSFL